MTMMLSLLKTVARFMRLTTRTTWVGTSLSVPARKRSMRSESWASALSVRIQQPERGAAFTSAYSSDCSNSSYL